MTFTLYAGNYDSVSRHGNLLWNFILPNLAAFVAQWVFY